jgi:hypothetical protein
MNLLNGHEICCYRYCSISDQDILLYYYTLSQLEKKGGRRRHFYPKIKEITEVIILFILALVSLFAFSLPYLLTEED